MNPVAAVPDHRSARHVRAACIAVMFGLGAAPIAHAQTIDPAAPLRQTMPDAAIREIGGALEQLENLAAQPAEVAPDAVAAPAPPETVTPEQRARVAALRGRIDALRDGDGAPADIAALQAIETLEARIATLETEAGAAAWRAQEYGRYRDAIRAEGLKLPAALALDGRPERGETRPSLEIAPEIVLVRSSEPKAAYASANLTDAAAPLPDGAQILRLGLYRAEGVRLVVAWALGRGQLFTGEQDLAPFDFDGE